MHASYIIPDWFFGFSVGMEILFSIVTFLVAMFAFKINSITRERKIKMFGIAFLLISLSYIAWAGLNYWFVKLISDGFLEVSIDNVAVLGTGGLYLYMVLFVSGLVTLCHITYYAPKEKTYFCYSTCNNCKGKSYYLLIGLSLLVIASSLYKLVSFRILSIFLISFIVYHYFWDYVENKNKKELPVFLAFVLLLLSNIVFLFLSLYYQAYVIGHILELIAAILILITLIKSVKK